MLLLERTTLEQDAVGLNHGEMAQPKWPLPSLFHDTAVDGHKTYTGLEHRDWRSLGHKELATTSLTS